MYARKCIRPFQITIAAGALGALFAAVPAQASDQGAWLQQQLSITDGGAPYGSFVAGDSNTGSVERDAQSEWLQGQLAISDGSAPVIGSGDAKQSYAASRPSDESNKQFAFVEHGLRQTDGCNE